MVRIRGRRRFLPRDNSFCVEMECKMNMFKKLLCMLMTLAVLFSALAGCGAGESQSVAESGDESGENGNTDNGTKGSYAVSLKTAGGMPLSDIDIYVYTDSTLTELEQFGKTDENGNASFELAAGKEYAFTLSGVPKGYDVKDYYGFTGKGANVILASSVIQGENLADGSFGVGDVIYDFTVTDIGGNKLTLSELLKEKKLVMLNFWYTTCTWCLTEFPVMDEVYGDYSDEVAIIALNPMEGDDAIKSFALDMPLSFPMAACPSSWAASFGIQGYPTSVFIDRYGTVCLVESGAIKSKRPFLSVFDHFTADEYQQKLCTSIGDLVTSVKPDKTMDSSEAVGEAINSGDITVTYRPETEGNNWEYSWPFIVGEKDGEKCVYSTNKDIESSFAIMYADVELKAGQAIGFDYYISSESLCDILYVIVNDDDIYQISGEKNEWASCYPCVAEKDGTYELALCYLKDDADNAGEDRAYIKNMRVVNAEDIDVASYLPRNAATSEDGFEYSYVDIVFNEEDGYYHVGTADGPLLLADLMGITPFNEEKSVFDLIYGGSITEGGHNYYDDIVKYCSFASNSSLNGVCTVNKELGDLLKVVARIAGFDGDENEWLKICKYFTVYGKDAHQLVDPIEGLAPFSAPSAYLGKGNEANYFYYDRPIIPRGLLREFIPQKSGAYRITSHNESKDGVDAWIFNADHKIILTYELCERMFEEDGECSMVYYMEAGVPYYINIAFWDMYEMGYIYFDIEYIAPSYEYFRTASPGFFTYDDGTTGEEMNYTVSGGITPILKDGYYYEDLGKDENGNQLYGSLIYADFSGITSVFSSPIATVNTTDGEGNPLEIKGLIELGGFNFTLTEEDEFVLAYLKARNFDVEETDKYLREYWGDTYDSYAEIYQLDDVYEGRYHGKGEDLTAKATAYLDDMLDEKAHPERKGCVPVTEELAELLQMLMGKYTFKDVDHSWLKVCYYYDHIGA